MTQLIVDGCLLLVNVLILFLMGYIVVRIIKFLNKSNKEK